MKHKWAISPRVSHLVFLMISGIALEGCMLAKVSREELVGKYKLELPEGGVEFLQLQSDGGCIQEIHLRGKIYEAHGNWKYFQNNRVIFLKGIRSSLLFNNTIDPDIFGLPSNDIQALHSSRSLAGKVQIMAIKDVYYNKIE